MQGSPLSGLILAWLLNGVPTSDEARVFLCFDNLIVMARTPDGTRAMAHTLIAHFERCSAGPLALCEPEYFDNEPFDFLGYRFDPASPEIGISGRGHERITAQLVKAETVQEALFHDLWNDYQSRLAGNSLGTSLNPLLWSAPTYLWRALRNVRAGYAKVPASSPEWQFYLQESRWLAEWTDNGQIVSWHDNQFAEQGTPEHAQIRAVLKRSEDREYRP